MAWTEDQVLACVEWLSGTEHRRATVRKNRTAYGLKHSVEGWLRDTGRPLYIPEAAFIEACARAGVTTKPVDSGRGTTCAVSVRHEREMHRRRIAARALREGSAQSSGIRAGRRRAPVVD